MTHRHIFARAAVIAALLLVRSTSADVLQKETEIKKANEKK